MDTASLTIGDVTVAYSIFGQPVRTGIPVLAVAPWLLNRTALYPLAGVLAGHGRRVLVMDQPGQGDSSMPDDPAELTLPALAETTAAFIDRLGLGPVDYVGCAQAGTVATYLLAHHRHQLRSVVTIGAATADDHRLERLRPLARHLREHGTRGDIATTDGSVEVIAALTRLCFGAWTLAHHRSLVDQWATHFRSLGPAIGEVTQAMIEYAPAVDVSAPGVPVLTIAGEQDLLCPPQTSGSGFAAATGGTAVVIERAGNSAGLEQPDLVAQHLQDFYTGPST